jgi:hypothetical protein
VPCVNRSTRLSTSGVGSINGDALFLSGWSARS